MRRGGREVGVRGVMESSGTIFFASALLQLSYVFCTVPLLVKEARRTSL